MEQILSEKSTKNATNFIASVSEQRSIFLPKSTNLWIKNYVQYLWHFTSLQVDKQSHKCYSTARSFYVSLLTDTQKWKWSAKEPFNNEKNILADI